MKENLNEEEILDFVGIDDRLKRVCVKGYKDNFEATYYRGQWLIIYPDFEDLMDNFIQMKDKERAKKYSDFARETILSSSN